MSLRLSAPWEAAAGRSRGKLALLLLWTLGVFGGWLVLPFVAAGTARWVPGWAYFGLLLLVQGGHQRYVRRHDPELLQRRKHIGQGTLAWDMIWTLLFWPLLASVAVVAGLDHRLGWSPAPVWLWPLGLALVVFGMGISARAMAHNPHFEGTVRLQTDRDHRVIDAGPYRRVRHPGYLGLALWALAGPFLLLSWAALIPAAAVVAWVALRTALEDRFLRRELAGYADYAARVRWRLWPGLW